MIKWSNEGLIFDLKKQYDNETWAFSHAQLPTAYILDDAKGICRVFFAARSSENISRIGYFDFDLVDRKILSRSDKPVLDVGDIGYFDQYGVYPSCIIKDNTSYKLFYIGWIRGNPQPLFYASVGVAESNNLEDFKKKSRAPVVDRSHYDPCIVTSPNVIKKDDLYYMAYVSGDQWLETQNGYSSRYNIKLATSKDLINWSREGKVLIDYANENETHIARACMLEAGGEYHMWFSFVTKTKKYQMGYATSKDLIEWKRSDEGLVSFKSTTEFDNEMMCYPSIVKFNNELYMFYNGNNYGKDGVMLAVGKLD